MAKTMTMPNMMKAAGKMAVPKKKAKGKKKPVGKGKKAPPMPMGGTGYTFGGK